MNTPPVACTLPANEHVERVTLIGDINASHLRRYDREGLTLHLTYAATATPRLRELVARERLCCAFLSFDLTEGADVTVLQIKVPDAEASAVDSLFSPFLEGAPATAARSRET